MYKRQDCDFSKSRCIYLDKTRYANKSMLFTRLQNGQLKKREWLMYSNSKGSFYCVPCKLFHSDETENSFIHGFNDWKHISRLSQHERSSEHRINTQSYVIRGNLLGKIDSALHQQYLKEVDYWQKVLICVFFFFWRLSSFRVVRFW